MKRLILLSMLAFSASAFAQSIPNAGFETWINTGSYEDPQGWGTFNFLSLYGNPITATKSTDAHSGTYAIRMESKLVTNNPNPAAFPDTIHTIYSGSTVPLVFGFPYTQKPDQLQMFYKSTSVNNSTAGVLAYLLKWNSTLHRRDTVAKAASYMADNTVYQQLNVPFIYLNPTLTPDTAIIFTSPIAYNTQNQIGAVLLVDDISFVLPTGINATEAAAPELIMANGTAYLSNVTSPSTVTIYSVDGKMIFKKENILGQRLEFDFASGVYTYAIRNKEGHFTGKIAVSK